MSKHGADNLNADRALEELLESDPQDVRRLLSIAGLGLASVRKMAADAAAPKKIRDIAAEVLEEVGDPAWPQDFVDFLANTLKPVLMKRGHADAVLAESIVQDVCVELLPRLSRIERPESYAMTTAFRELSARRKKRAKETELTEADLEAIEADAVSPEQQVIQQQAEQLLHEAIQGVSNAKYQRYLRHYVDGDDDAEIDRRMGLSPKRRRVLKFRALRSLGNAYRGS